MTFKNDEPRHLLIIHKFKTNHDILSKKGKEKTETLSFSLDAENVIELSNALENALPRCCITVVIKF